MDAVGVTIVASKLMTLTVVLTGAVVSLAVTSPILLMWAVEGEKRLPSFIAVEQCTRPVSAQRRLLN